MTVLARRLYYSSAIIVFLVVGPLLLAWTSGFRWTGTKSGFVRTGALIISSDPRATVVINGQTVGETPQRRTHVTPGNYVVELRAVGYGPWRQVLRIQADAATVVGPVILFPTEFQRTPVTVPAGTTVLPDTYGRSVASWQSHGTDWTVDTLWPDTYHAPVVLPWQPARLWTSPNSQVQVFVDQVATAVVRNGDSPWFLPAISPPLWDPSSETIFYALVQGHLHSYDVLQRQTADLGPVSSFLVQPGLLWSTLTAGSTTTLQKRPLYGQAQADHVLDLPGTWSLVPSDSGQVLMQNATTKELVDIGESLTGQVVTTSFGPADALWWAQRSEPPIWQSGSDLFTQDAQHQPMLIDRTDQIFRQVRWVVPDHILLLVTDHHVSLRSISSRQGRGVLLEAPLPPQTQVVGLDLAHRSLVLAGGTPSALTVWRW